MEHVICDSRDECLNIRLSRDTTNALTTDVLKDLSAALNLNLVHGVDESGAIEKLAWQQLLFLRDLAPEALAESKRMRAGRFCARIREQMSARVARQVELWNSTEAQTRLREAAKRLAR